MPSSIQIVPAMQYKSKLALSHACCNTYRKWQEASPDSFAAFANNFKRSWLRGIELYRKYLLEPWYRPFRCRTAAGPVLVVQVEPVHESQHFTMLAFLTCRPRRDSSHLQRPHSAGESQSSGIGLRHAMANEIGDASLYIPLHRGPERNQYFRRRIS